MRPYYEHAGCAIYHGDAESVVSDLGQRWGLLLADPPYGINFAAQPTVYQRAAGMKAQSWDSCAPDVSPFIAATEEQVIWGGNYFSLPPSRGWLAWCKPDAPPSMGTIEFAWTSLDRCARHFTQSIAATNPERVGHPNQKPLALMKWCIQQVGIPYSILDPYMGSGTSLVAAKSFGVPAVGVDREEAYCEMAAKRLAQETLFGFERAS